MSVESEYRRQRQNTYAPFRWKNARMRASVYNYTYPQHEPTSAEEMIETYDYYEGWCFYCGERALWTMGMVSCMDGDRDNRDPGNLAWACKHCGKQKIHADSCADGPLTASQYMDKKHYVYKDVREKWFDYWVRHYGSDDFEFGYLQYSPKVCEEWVKETREKTLQREAVCTATPEVHRTNAPRRGTPELEARIKKEFGAEFGRYAKAQDRARKANRSHKVQTLDAFKYYDVFKKSGQRCAFCHVVATWEGGRVTNFRPLRANPDEVYDPRNLVWVCASCAHKKATTDPYKLMKGKLARENITPRTFVAFCDAHTDAVPKGEGAFVEKQRSLIP